MARRKTPQEKKHESYEKDRRNAYGERGSKSRFAIACSKKRPRRADRRVTRLDLAGATGRPDVDLADRVEHRTKADRPVGGWAWRKQRDVTLREWLQEQQDRMAHRDKPDVRARKATHRRSWDAAEKARWALIVVFGEVDVTIRDYRPPLLLVTASSHLQKIAITGWLKGELAKFLAEEGYAARDYPQWCVLTPPHVWGWRQMPHVERPAREVEELNVSDNQDDTAA
jgi:hypothetical protein